MRMRRGRSPASPPPRRRAAAGPSAPATASSTWRDLRGELRAALRRWAFVLAVCAAAAASGIQVAFHAQEMRGSFMRLGDVQRQRDALLAEYSRLLLERATLSSYRHVGEMARERLSMRFPEAVTPVVRP